MYLIKALLRKICKVKCRKDLTLDFSQLHPPSLNINFPHLNHSKILDITNPNFQKYPSPFWHPYFFKQKSPTTPSKPIFKIFYPEALAALKIE